MIVYIKKKKITDIMNIFLELKFEKDIKQKGHKH